MKATEPPGPIRISTNTIIGNRFFYAYEPLPFARVEDLPENLRPLVVTGEPEAEGPNEPCGAFQLNTRYQLTSDGRLGRRLQREVAQMEAENEFEGWVEEQMDAPLPPEVAQGLQEEHENSVAFAAAQLAADASRSDAASDAAADRKPESPMVNAMLAAARKHPLNKTAVLRCC